MAKGIFFLFFFIFVQIFLGRWMIWSQVMPEGDFAALVLLGFSLGRLRGAFLGSFLGAFRDSFSSHPFGLGIFVLAGVGFVSGFFGERRRMMRPWQRSFFIFSALLLSDSVLLLLGGWGSSFSPEAIFSFYGESIFPTAALAALIGFFIGPLFR
ncbi:MAG: hypothetical protein IH877_03700 [Gemmatimonadetes bacterium]|nr:hypothetical protein [Gemmatimonadota bacterium]